MTNTAPPKNSIFGNIKERREQALRHQYLDVPVPRWSDPAPIVRFGPVDFEYIRAGQEKIEKAKGAGKAQLEMNVNTDLLIKSCIGIYAEIDGVQYAFDEDNPEREDWPTFGPELAKNLGLFPTVEEAVDAFADRRVTARTVVKTLYLQEMDILSTAGKILKWLGDIDQESNGALLGE